ncbi:MAG: DUF3737 family protein [Clostridia bacterium]|nr:DUF3737 family protein [Clostridia bacterium]
MKEFSNQNYDQERAFYGEKEIFVHDCTFAGPADGESAFKECADVRVQCCEFDLRYPFWHVQGLEIGECELKETCRAALWYSTDIDIKHTALHGIKALRECRDVHITDCTVRSAEFGWMSAGVEMKDVTAEGEYFMFRGENLRFENMTFKGKYSFQYVKNAVFEHCDLDTKDAFWHAENVVVKNCRVKGEYLAWYAKNITFENCTIIGTQPLCYCQNLKLINCEMQECDLAFERSEVEAEVTTPVLSIKNPLAGSYITVPAVGEVILDIPEAKGKVQISTASK